MVLDERIIVSQLASPPLWQTLLTIVKPANHDCWRRSRNLTLAKALAA